MWKKMLQVGSGGGYYPEVKLLRKASGQGMKTQEVTFSYDVAVVYAIGQGGGYPFVYDIKNDRNIFVAEGLSNPLVKPTYGADHKTIVYSDRQTGKMLHTIIGFKNEEDFNNFVIDYPF